MGTRETKRRETMNEERGGERSAEATTRGVGHRSLDTSRTSDAPSPEEFRLVVK
jgi:hypothetical protein